MATQPPGVVHMGGHECTLRGHPLGEINCFVPLTRGSKAPIKCFIHRRRVACSLRTANPHLVPRRFELSLLWDVVFFEAIELVVLSACESSVASEVSGK